MRLTKDNYFSKEADQQCMSVSQYKSFLQCEAAAMAKLSGEYQEEQKDAFLGGSYVHAWNEGVLEKFKKDNPALYKKNGELYAKYSNLDDMIKALEGDRFCMMALEGKKEVVLRAELFGVPWKIMIDSYNPTKGRFADLKAVKSLNDRFYNKELGQYVNFIQHYGYTTQIAVYSEIERLFTDRDDYLEGFIVAVTKENPPNKAVIGFDEDMIQHELMQVEANLPRILQVKNGEVEAKKCGACDYCRSTKKLTGIIHYLEL